MRIAFGTDEHSDLIDPLLAQLRSLGHEVEVLADGDPWPEVGDRVGRAVVDGSADRGIVCCWTGTGVSIAANKVPGVRAALCTDAETARGARKWNDANVLALSLRLISPTVGAELVEAFLTAEPEADEADNIARLADRT